MPRHLRLFTAAPRFTTASYASRRRAISRPARAGSSLVPTYTSKEFTRPRQHAACRWVGCNQGIEARIERRWHTHQQRSVGPVGAKDRSHGWRPPKADKNPWYQAPRTVQPRQGHRNDLLPDLTNVVRRKRLNTPSLAPQPPPPRWGGWSFVGPGNYQPYGISGAARRVRAPCGVRWMPWLGPSSSGDCAAKST